MPQHRPHADARQRGPDGFQQEIVGAGFEPGDLIVRALDAGHHENGRELGPPVGAQPVAEIVPAHFRHHHVDNDQIYFFCFNDREGFRGAADFEYPVAVRPQRSLEEPAVDFERVHNQNRGGLTGVFEHVFPTRPHQCGLGEFDFRG